jgi:hypothetical protein
MRPRTKTPKEKKESHRKKTKPRGSEGDSNARGSEQRTHSHYLEAPKPLQLENDQYVGPFKKIYEQYEECFIVLLNIIKLTGLIFKPPLNSLLDLR